MAVKDHSGGAAFPGMTAVGHKDYAPGLSVRDYFAAQIVASAANSFRLRRACMAGQGDIAMKNLASMAYLLADAMIAEREK